MASYEIITTPGKERVAPLEGDSPLKTQDEAKIVLQQLRMEARARGDKVDFIIRRMDAGGGSRTASSGAAASSVRISEDNRAKVARFCGMLMMEKGDVVSMGDAVAMLVDHFERTKDFVNPITGELNEQHIVNTAKEILAERKAKKEAA